jgi:hypothetical protein
MAGVYVMLTRRCPFECAHCSTRSSPHSRESISQEDVLAFFETMRDSAQPPRVVYFTGGEALSRPTLLRRLAQEARGFGALTVAISGGFFGRSTRVHAQIASAIESLDAVHVSRDIFHEPFLDDPSFRRALSHVRELGKEVTVQYTLTPGEDRAAVTSQIREHFDGDILFSSLQPVGRGASLVDTSSTRIVADPRLPCDAAAWPVVTDRGRIVKCCNQSLVDAGAFDTLPAHVDGGLLTGASWDRLLDRSDCGSRLLRALTVLGPGNVVAPRPGESACAVCLRAVPGSIDSRVSAVRVDRLARAVAALQQASLSNSVT